MIQDSVSPQLWHILTESSVPVAEFGLALSRVANVIAWVPETSSLGCIQNWTRVEHSDENIKFRRVHFPLQRGLSRFSFGAMSAAYRKIYALLMNETGCASRTALVCTSSFYAPVAQMWEGPVIYYATDYTFAYEGLSSERVLSADRDMCAIASTVCPNSARLARYFIERCGCPPERITIVPNATRTANLRFSAERIPDPLPSDVPSISRPIAGVIGSMAANLDWKLLAEMINRSNKYSWLFVGPSSMPIREQEVRRARAEVMKHPKATFIGAKPYRELVKYARAVDVAVMPYRKREPTYSGSATRFYEHLAAGRPIVSSRGVEELLHKEPLLHLADTADQMAIKLQLLLDSQGQDGYEEARLIASQAETWERRAEAVINCVRKSISTNKAAFLPDGVSSDRQYAAGTVH